MDRRDEVTKGFRKLVWSVSQHLHNLNRLHGRGALIENAPLELVAVAAAMPVLYLRRDFLCYQSFLFLVARELTDVFRLGVALLQGLWFLSIIWYCIANRQGSNALTDTAQNPSISFIVEPLAWSLARAWQLYSSGDIHFPCSTHKRLCCCYCCRYHRCWRHSRLQSSTRLACLSQLSHHIHRLRARPLNCHASGHCHPSASSSSTA